MHSYDATLPTPMDYVRFLIGDTDAPWQLTNTEIDALLSKAGGHEFPAAIQACRALSARYTRKSGNSTVGPFSINYLDMATGYADLAVELERQQIMSSPASPYVSGFKKAGKEANEQDETINQLPIRVGIMDNPANQQFPEDQYGRWR